MTTVVQKLASNNTIVQKDLSFVHKDFAPGLFFKVAKLKPITQTISCSACKLSSAFHKLDSWMSHELDQPSLKINSTLWPDLVLFPVTSCLAERQKFYRHCKSISEILGKHSTRYQYSFCAFKSWGYRAQTDGLCNFLEVSMLSHQIKQKQLWRIQTPEVQIPIPSRIST